MLQFCLKPRRGSNFNNISFSRVLFSCPNLHELSFIILIEHLDFSSPCSQFEILLVFLSLGCPPPSKKLPEDTGGFFVDIFGGGPRWVVIAGRGLSLVAVRGGCSSLQCTGFSLWWLLLLRSTGSRCAGFSSCGTWAL